LSSSPSTILMRILEEEGGYDHFDDEERDGYGSHDG
jgi:hypothetical protein